MIIEKFIQQMQYNNNDELKDAYKYIHLKGMPQYQRIINYVKNKFNIEIPHYSNIANIYRYDKRLRYNLYIYIGFIEEYFRAYIGNTYEDNELDLATTASFLAKKKTYSSVSLTLEKLMFGELAEMVLKNKQIFNSFYDIENLRMNLNALRDLRNKIAHQNFLLEEKYKDCNVAGKVDNTLKNNILNLYQFLPKDYQNGFTKDINSCINNLDLSNCIKVII